MNKLGIWIVITASAIAIGILIGAEAAVIMFILWAGIVLSN